MEKIRTTLSVERLVHDVPVDTRHVTLLATSLRERGQIAPVIARVPSLVDFTLNDPAALPIIDGFHRTEAFRSIDQSHPVDVELMECSDEEFGDLRITAAVLHRDVTFARVTNWAQEIFASSPWAHLVTARDAFIVADKVSRPNAIIYKAAELGQSSTTMQELAEWIDKKATIWGLPAKKIAEMLELSEALSPKIVPIIREKPEPGTHTFPRGLAKRLAEAVPDQELQELFVDASLKNGIESRDVQMMLSSIRLNQDPLILAKAIEDPINVVRSMKSPRRTKLANPSSEVLMQRSIEAKLIADATMLTIRILQMNRTGLYNVQQMVEAMQDLNEATLRFTVRGDALESAEQRIEELTKEINDLRHRLTVEERDNRALRRTLGFRSRLGYSG